jgi:hypothetical protein
VWLSAINIRAAKLPITLTFIRNEVIQKGEFVTLAPEMLNANQRIGVVAAAGVLFFHFIFDKLN